jgi:hypothetical protein
MSWRWSATSLLLLGGAVYLTACAVYVWRYCRGPTAASLVVLAALAQWGVARAGAIPATRHLFQTCLPPQAPGAAPMVRYDMARTSRPYHRQSALLLGSLALPLGANLLTTLNLGPLDRSDLLPSRYC